MSKAPNITKDRIVVDSNPILRNKSVDVNLPLSEEDEQTLKDMVEYLEMSQDDQLAEKYDLQPGVGIAAPQIGIFKNMFAILAEDEKGNVHEYALVNPKLISNSASKAYLASGEGCLSVPESHKGYVKRYAKIKMSAYDYLSNKNVVLSIKGYVAIVLQHEYDHLFGILYYDRIDKVNPFKHEEGEIVIE